MKRQFNILNYFNMRALFMGIGLSRILIRTNELFIISIILGTILGSIILSCLKIELKNKYINIFASSILIIISLIIVINMISTMYLTEMPKWLVGLPLIFLILYILSKEEIVIFRVGSILIVLNLLLYFLTFTSLVQIIEPINFTYTGTTFNNVLIGALEYTLYSITPIYITKDKDYATIPLVKTYVISSITMSILFILTYGILGSKLVNIFRYPEYIILKKITFLDTLANVQNIISFIWIFDILMLLLSCGNCIKKSLNNKKLIYIIIPLLLIITSIINKHYVAIISVYKYCACILGGLFILLILFNKKVRN